MKIRQFIILFLVIIIGITLGAVDSRAAAERRLTILHTNDLHSNLLGFSPNLAYNPSVTGQDKTRGGFARLATLLERERKSRNHPTLTLDGGDFLMGTLFHMLAREEAFELLLLRALGYDALVLGNHEFDLKPRGLARIISTAAARNALPKLLLANAIFSAESKQDDSLEEIFRQGLVKPYTVIIREGIKVGIFGVMGKDAAQKAPFAAPVKFADPVPVAREMVRLLREKEGVDLVVCLSHSGIRQKVAGDENLASEVPGIDVIIGGHSHTRLANPLTVGTTLIVQAGAHGRYAGALDLIIREGKVNLEAYRLHPVDSRIPADPVIQQQIEDFMKAIDERILKGLGLGFNKVLAKTSFDLTIEAAESPLGNLIADATLAYANRFAYDKKDPKSKVLVAIESNGLIREDILAGPTGKLAVTDIFRALPMGIGPDDEMGYPLVACYLYAQEIKKALEVLTSVYPLKGSSFYLQVSGLKFTYNPYRVPFDRVTGIWLGSGEDGFQPLDYSKANRELYRLAANIYNAAFLQIIGNFTYGILTIIPKDREGRPMTNLADFRLDANPDKPGIQEVKQWLGLMEYFRSFADTDNDAIPDVPEKYRLPSGRIVSEASLNPLALFSGANWVTWTALGLLAAGLLLVAAMFFLLRRLVRRLLGA